METAIVTGGAGFIGSHLCSRLLDMGYRVIAIDTLITSSGKNIDHLKENDNFQFIHQDVTLPLAQDLKADYVFHLASPASPNHHSEISYHKLAMETMMVNTLGTHQLLDFALRNRAKFLFASTSEVYGDPLQHPQKESYNGNVSPTGPRSVYDESKRFGETLVAYYVREKNVDARIIRIFNTYGPGMNMKDLRMLIVFILQALKGQPITIFGDGKQTRSLCYVADTVEGMIKLMFSSNTKGEIVNIGSPEEHTVLEYANMIKDLVNADVKIEFSEALPQNDPLRRQPDITKARQLLNWEPKISLQDGMKKTIDYFKSELLPQIK